jgi:PRTRC genetic system protein E
MSLFTELAEILQGGEGLTFGIRRSGNDLVVLVQPGLKTPVTETDTPDDAAQLRAALAMPLRISGTPAMLDAELPAKLREYARARTSLAEQFDALDVLREARKGAERLANKAQSTSAPVSPSPADNGGAVPSGSETDDAAVPRTQVSSGGLFD